MWPKLNTMRHFVTLVACLASFIALAQNPNYDPDSNGDDLIGAEDLVSLLGVYNTSLAVDTTLECDFDGTAEDEWLFGVLSGEVVIDSVVVQYSISDSTTYYEPGCPIQQVYYLDVELEYSLTEVLVQSPTLLRLQNSYQTPWSTGSSNYARIEFDFVATEGTARIYWYDWNLYFLRQNGGPYNSEFHFPYNTAVAHACVNVSENAATFELTENGIEMGMTCSGNETWGGAFTAPEYNYFRILPYWHYAE